MKLCLRCDAQFDSAEWLCPRCGAAPERRDGTLAFAPQLTQGAEGFREEFFAELSRLEAGNFWFGARNSLILWATSRFFPSPRRVLEIGCGTGFVLAALEKAFPSASLWGSEIFTSGLEFAARRLSRANLIQMDARHIPFRAEFDVVGAFDVIEHIEEDQRVLSEIHDSLAPGGGTVITVPQHPFLWTRQDELACHVRRYSRAEIRRKLDAAGFDVLFVTSFVSFLLPLMVLSRVRRNVNQDADALAELRLHPAINAALGMVLRLELALIRLGVRFPMGGSLIVVARKRGD